jgi:ABC-2 type transport system permease protein
MEYYGINFVDGIVLESKQGYYMGQYVNNLVPNIESHDITTDIKTDKESIVVPTAVGIVKSDSARSSITIDPILTTSDGSYSKVDINSSVVDKEDGDIDGPFNLGVAITENYNNVETKLVVYGSSYIIDESMVSYAALGNLDLFLNSVNFVSGKEDSLAIRTRSVTQEYLTLNAAQVNFWAVIIVVIIPVLVLSLGGFVCLRRRKK